MPIRKTLTGVILLLIFTLIGVIFYKIELKYLTPTPIPEGFQPVALNTKISICGQGGAEKENPTLYHFYNPDCPCSRFNFDHFRTLVQTYPGTIKFVIVAQENSKESIVKVKKHIGDIQGIQIVMDKDKSLANSMGVYSTPQAVLTDAHQQIYYRGNYNKSRYCTDPGKYFVQQAIDSLIAGKERPDFGHYAHTPYGCQVGEKKDFLDQLVLFNK